MTIFSDETLMAFADEELDPETRIAVEAAIRADPAVERRVAQHRAMRARIQRTYTAELDEAVPERLLAVARGLGTKLNGSVSDLTEARIATAARAARNPAAGFRWRPMLSMAASLLIGVGAAYFALRHSDSIITKNDGALVASGDLAKALSNQSSSDRSPAAPVQIGFSFRAKSGDYCRTFTMLGAASPGGIACHHANDWQIQVLARSAGGASSADSPANYRTANSALSPVILNAVQQQIAGDPLDEKEESAARQRGWQPRVP
jgi:hypothetical protein